MKRRKRPKVIIRNGSESTRMIGRTKALSKPSRSVARIKPDAVYVMPGTILAASMTATVVIIQRLRKDAKFWDISFPALPALNPRAGITSRTRPPKTRGFSVPPRFSRLPVRLGELRMGVA